MRPILLLYMGTSLGLSVVAAFLGVALHALLLRRLYESARGGTERAPPPGFLPPPLLTWRLGWAAVVVAMAVGLHQLQKIDLEDRVEITAHRGSSRYAPENTLSALERAVSDGADWAEIDVQETADGIVVLLHDQDFVRLGGVDRKVWELTLAEVQALDVGRWFDVAFEGERVPTLREAIGAIRGRLALNVELKYNGHERALAERVIEVLRSEEFTDQVVITSLNFEGLRRVRDLDPELPIGHIVARSIGDIVLLDGDVLSVATSSVSAALVLAAQAAGKEIHVWTVNAPSVMSRMIDLGVDNIITDEPATLRRLLDERAAMTDEELLSLKVRNWFRR